MMVIIKNSNLVSVQSWTYLEFPVSSITFSVFHKQNYDRNFKCTYRQDYSSISASSTDSPFFSLAIIYDKSEKGVR